MIYQLFSCAIGNTLIGADRKVKRMNTMVGYAELKPDYQTLDRYYTISDWLGNARAVERLDGNVEMARDYYPYGLEMPGRVFISAPEAERYQFQGHERDEVVDYDFHGARYYNPTLGVYMSVDPLAHLRTWVSPYNFVQNNPINRVDPTGALDGDYYDKEGSYLGNDGKDDDRVYTVEGTSKFNAKDFGEGGKYDDNETAYNENNGDGFSVTYEGDVTETKLSFSGSANTGNSKQADGQLGLIQILGNGKEFTKQSLDAIGGPYGNGAPPNGDYTVDGGRLRTESGFSRGGFGFSFNLNPTFQTGRTLLRIHPDGNKTGTLGCVGVNCSSAQGRSFYNNVNSAINKSGALNMNINILNNPNNQGGGFVPNINE